MPRANGSLHCRQADLLRPQIRTRPAAVLFGANLAKMTPSRNILRLFQFSALAVVEHDEIVELNFVTIGVQFFASACFCKYFCRSSGTGSAQLIGCRRLHYKKQFGAIRHRLHREHRVAGTGTRF